MKPKLKNALLSLGLKNEEIDIYLTLLKLKQALLSEIARELGVNRTTLYPYIDGLLKRSLVRKSIKGKRIVYVPESPKKLLDIKRGQDKLLSFALPELEKMFSDIKEKPEVLFFSGKRSISDIYDKMTQNPGFLYSIFSPKEYFKLFNENDGEKFLQNIEKYGIELKELVPNDKDGKEYKEYGYTPLLGKPFKFKKHEVRILPKDINIENDILINSSSIALVSPKTETAIWIQNESLSNTFKSIFNFLWQLSDK